MTSMTDTINHHLTDALLMAYSAGTLPEAFSLAVATHVSMCDECRARLGAYDTVGGALLNESETVTMEPGSLEATLALIAGSEEARDATVPCQVGSTDDVLPAPVRDYVGGGLDDVKWRPVGMGVKQAILPTVGDAEVRLLHIPAGVAMPDHGHTGTEITLVLKGAFIDDKDRFARGDVEVADEKVNHTPVADIGEDCICLAATEAPLKFKGLMPRIAQPFLRI